MIRGNPPWFAEIDVLPTFEIPPARACKKCGGTAGRIRENVHGQDVVYCAECRTHVYNVPKKESGKPQRSFKSRPDLPFGARARILRMDGQRCFLCGRGAEQGVFLDVAHVISVKEAREAGVSDEETFADGNLFACCEECNHEMGPNSAPQKMWLRIMLHRTNRGMQK